MSYTKTIWKDQQVENPIGRRIVNNPDGTAQVYYALGEVTELGTPVNAENMNNIENGIDNLYKSVAIYDVNTEYNSSSLVFSQGEDVKLYKSLQNNNRGNDLTNGLYWAEVGLGGGTSSMSQQLTSFPASCIGGNCDGISGYPDLFDCSDNTKISFKAGGNHAPLDVVFPDGEFKRFSEIEDFEVGSLADGEYNLYINKEGEISAYSNNYYVSRTTPRGGTTNIYYTTETRNITNEYNWSQPVLSANGTMGGSSFAAQADWEQGSYSAYKAFDGSNVTASYWSSDSSSAHPYPHWITFYNPTPLKVTSLTVKNRAGGYYEVKDYTVLASNNNTNWTTIASGTNSVSGGGNSWTINLGSNTNFYKYYRLSSTSHISGSGTYICIGEINITAKYQTVTTETYQQKHVEITGSSLSQNDIWLNTSSKPYSSFIYNGVDFEEVSLVKLPQKITVTSGVITSVETANPYNSNGWDEQLSCADFERQTALTKGVSFTAPCIGWVYNYTESQIYQLEKGYGFTPLTTSSGTWYFSPIKGV